MTPPDTNPTSRLTFSALNLPEEAIPEHLETFTLTAAPNTDLWRKPPARDTSTAPVLFTSLRFPFVAAEVTVCADWRLEWDQAGLVIFAGAPPGRPVERTEASTSSSSAASTTGQRHQSRDQQRRQQSQSSTNQSSTTNSTSPPAYTPPAQTSKWVKVGLEFLHNQCHASSVCATSDGADWSISSLPFYHGNRSDLRVKFERVGHALWLYYDDQQLGWKKLREVTWFFWGVDDKQVRVGVYASRPASFQSDQQEERRGGCYVQRDLSVEFEDLRIF